MNALQSNTFLKNDFTIPALPVNINEVIEQLEIIIENAKANNSSAGYFAVLYHKVTCRIKECISEKDFEDCVRMERFDVLFACRYLNAYYSYISAKKVSKSWQIAFEATTENKSLVLQHLLTGMNAHINLDLGIAAANVMQNFALDDIHNDFNTINSILATMINNIEGCLTKINPLMKLLHLNWYNYDEMLVKFSINTARDGAWEFAQEVSGKAGSAFDDCFNIRDNRIAELGKIIIHPIGILLKIMVKLIHLFEKKNVVSVIKSLGE